MSSSWPCEVDDKLQKYTYGVKYNTFPHGHLSVNGFCGGFKNLSSIQISQLKRVVGVQNLTYSLWPPQLGTGSRGGLKNLSSITISQLPMPKFHNCQCQSRKASIPILRHNGIWRTADEAVLNKVMLINIKKSPLYNWNASTVNSLSSTHLKRFFEPRNLANFWRPELWSSGKRRVNIKTSKIL